MIWRLESQLSMKEEHANFAASLHTRQNGRECLHALGHLGYRVVKTKTDHFAHVGLTALSL